MGPVVGRGKRRKQIPRCARNDNSPGVRLIEAGAMCVEDGAMAPRGRAVAFRGRASSRQSW